MLYNWNSLLYFHVFLTAFQFRQISFRRRSMIRLLFVGAKSGGGYLARGARLLLFNFVVSALTHWFDCENSLISVLVLVHFSPLFISFFGLLFLQYFLTMSSVVNGGEPHYTSQRRATLTPDQRTELAEVFQSVRSFHCFIFRQQVFS